MVFFAITSEKLTLFCEIKETLTRNLRCLIIHMVFLECFL